MKRKKFKKTSLLLIPMMILYYIVTSLYIKEIYYYNAPSSIMQYIVYGAIALAGLLVIIFTIWGLTCILKNRTKTYIVFFIFLILVTGGQYFVTYNASKVSESIAKVTDNFTTYSSSLIVLRESNIKKSSDITGKVGMISDTKSMEGYVVAKKLAKKENISNSSITKYDDYTNMLKDLYDKKIDAVLISSSYADMFSTDEQFENIKNDVKEIAKKSVTQRRKKSKSTKTLTKPFTVLVMGVDSTTNSLKNSNSFNGDTLMLMTFNPKTMNATILSIPRDTRVPITCNRNRLNKINSSSMYGTDCVIDTVSNLTGVEIDYWVKVNFQGVVSLVDAVGGVEVDVPYAFCEQDSKRRWGKHTVYVEKGKQTLNGEQALAFARNRHTWPEFCGKKYSKYVSNDFIRGQNQQTIVKALANKLKSTSSLSQVYKLLDVLGNNIDTNISKDTMITGFDTFKNIITKSKNINGDDFIGTQRLYLSGRDKMINGIYYFEHYEQSLDEIVYAMKVNLGLKKPIMDKDFSFSINKPYEDVQIGKGTYKY